MHRGYIFLYRKALHSQVFQNDYLWRLFSWLLLSASHKEYALLAGNTVVTLQPGQLITGRKALAGALASSEQKIRTGLNNLEKLGVIRQKPTNRFTIISIVNWHAYQDTPLPASAFATSGRPTANQQPATNKNKEYKDDEYLNHHQESITLPCLEGGRYVPAVNDVREWQSTYHPVDVTNALKRMRQWCLSNPSRQKSQREIRRFVTNWLDREQKDTAAKSGGQKTKARIKNQLDPGDYRAGVHDMTEFGYE